MTSMKCPKCSWPKLTEFWSGWLKYLGCVRCLTYFFYHESQEGRKA
jgi:hypothetical protein